MKIIQRSAPWISIGVLLAQMACQTPTETPSPSTGKATKVSGVVLRSDNGTKVPTVVVRDIKGAPFDTTKADGSFQLTYNIIGSLSTQIVAHRDLFRDDTATIRLREGVDTSGVTLTLKADSTSPITNVSGPPAVIVLVGIDIANISIRGTGMNESALLTFEVRDSLGTPVVGTQRATVKFSILGGPGGGEYVFPAVSQTEPSTGKVFTRIASGTKPGVLQVNATTRGDSVKSGPVRVSIASGLPDSAHFSISMEKVNIPGGVFDNVRSKILVILGDRYGNPVQAGTAIYFKTTGGSIQPFGTTDKDGIASVDIISANPRPIGGIALITAQTVGDTSVRRSDSLVTRTIPILFSGAPRISAPASAGLIQDSGKYQFNYKVSDLNGNPLSAGTNIKVSVAGAGSGDIVLTGDVDRTLIDTRDTNFTNYSVLLTDKTRGGAGGIVDISIDVTSPNGNTSYKFSGVLLSVSGGGTGPGGGVGKPYAIEVNGTPNTKLSVNESGAQSSAATTIQFVVKDSLNNPIIANPLNPSAGKAYVLFSLVPSGGLGGEESVFPSADSTNDYGQVHVVFRSGTKAGLVRLVATTLVAGRPPITSGIDLTISGGFPDSNRITMGLSRQNMPGLVRAGTIGSVQ
ncbi:MAG: Ig-like domain-containing protein, partial [Ignavibacteriales bacterium]|nr:Ig-like domain-containing protein [Ignavibacteriales bacterium]